jgi:hypothetical protein
MLWSHADFINEKEISHPGCNRDIWSMKNESKVRKPTGARYLDEVREHVIRMLLEHQRTGNAERSDPLDCREDRHVA